MKKALITILVALTCLVGFTSCGYNGLVAQREDVDSAWANVENQYQRRADLVPNLVASVKAYAKHEEQVYSEIAESRAKLGSMNVSSDITEDPEKFAQFQQAQSQLSSSLSRLIAISEAYPQLKANENFRDLQSQLEGTENRIATERKRYNDAVKAYNTSVQRFPTVITAKMFHFNKKEYFKAEESAYKAPVVSFE